jgi:multicomponent Na+:H+ antiporter subunit E
MKRSIALAAWLVIAWLALWRDLNFANVFTGVMFAVILVVAFPVGRATGPDDAPVGPRSGWRTAGFTVRPWPALEFLLFFTWKLIEANAIVAWQVVRPASSIAEGIVAVELHTRSDGIATMVADAVTLTPGTMTIDIDRPAVGPITLFIHVLQLGDPDDIRSDTWTFESMALAAFGDPTELERPLSTETTSTTDEGDGA